MDEGAWGVISVDDHLIEPPQTWTSRVPERFRDRCPRLVETEGGIAWQFDGTMLPFVGLQCMVDHENSDWHAQIAHFEDLYTGCSDPVARLSDLDEAGILASLCFPTMPGFGASYLNNNPDRDLSMACIQAYNDFVIDEWCGAAPGRYIPLVLMPYWDHDLAAAEMRRTADKGARAIAFNERPHVQGWPSLFDADHYWDPFFAAAQDTDLVLCCHIGSSSQTDVPVDAHMLSRFSGTWVNAIHSFHEFTFSETFERFPQIRVAYSEASIGWMPFVLQLMDSYWVRHGGWTQSRSQRPTEYFGRNIFGCFIDDPVGASMIEDLGVDAVMVEVDYPHTDTIWPNVRKVVDSELQHLSSEDQYKVRRGNAERVFRFTPSAIGER